jgi:hypothetical protein
MYGDSLTIVLDKVGKWGFEERQPPSNSPKGGKQKRIVRVSPHILKSSKWNY